MLFPPREVRKNFPRGPESAPPFILDNVVDVRDLQLINAWIADVLIVAESEKALPCRPELTEDLGETRIHVGVFRSPPVVEQAISLYLEQPGRALVNEEQPWQRRDAGHLDPMLLGHRLLLFGIPPKIIQFLTAAGRQQAVYSRLFDQLQVDQSATREALGWHPPFTAREQMAATVEWFQQQR